MVRSLAAVPPPTKKRRTFLDLADQTPASRDRYVDFLRALSILVVVVGHWLVTAVYWRNGHLVGINALERIPGLWLSTWILQVMPLFFFVGGFSNLVTLDSHARKRGNYSGFVHLRAGRLLQPTAVFLGVWLPLSIALEWALNLNGTAFRMSMMLLTAPLWFLAVYLMMIGLAPTMLKLHRRFGGRVPVLMAVGAVIVDVLRIQLDSELIGGLNYLFVWLFAHQLGFFYADGSLLRAGRKLYLAMAGGGLAGLVLLTTQVGYSSNMVFNVAGRSNTNPPTLCIMLLTIWQVGLVMLLRDPVSRWLAGRKPWAGVIALNSVMMTMFLWHMTAAVIVITAAYPLGFPGPEPGTPSWWLLRPAWIVMLAVVLAVLVALFGRFERGRASKEPSLGTSMAMTPARRAATVAGLIYCILAFVGFAAASFDGFMLRSGDSLLGLEMNPLQALLHLVIGWWLLAAGHTGDARARTVSWWTVAALSAAGALGVTVMQSNPSLNVIGANMNVHFLHLLTALAAGAVLLFGRRAGASRS